MHAAAPYVRVKRNHRRTRYVESESSQPSLVGKAIHVLGGEALPQGVLS